MVGLLPLGTGNDFARGDGHPPRHGGRRAGRCSRARSAGWTSSSTRSARSSSTTCTRAPAPRPAARGASGRRGLHAIGVGKVNLGKLGYPIGALLAAVHPPKLHLRVELDGEVVNDVDRPVLMVAIGNGAHIGGGTEVTPHADAEDGQARRHDLARCRARSRSWPTRSQMERRATTSSAMTWPTCARAPSTSPATEFWCSADGEIYGPERQRTWRLEPAAYSFVLP